MNKAKKKKTAKKNYGKIWMGLTLSYVRTFYKVIISNQLGINIWIRNRWME